MQRTRIPAPVFQLLLIVCAVKSFAGTLGPAPLPTGNVNNPNHPLIWDSMLKKYAAKPKDTTNQFFFTVTNTAKTNVTITAVEPSCGCTVAKLPSEPWVLKGGEHGTFSATVDFHGKFGELHKTLLVNSSAGHQVLTVQVDVPITEESKRREQNMEAARNDHQAVFKNDCARCHMKPALGKAGEDFYKAACAICHDAENRGSNVPDLHAINKKTYPKYWKYWLVNGGPFMMPAFSKEKGGFMTEPEMDALAEFLDKKFPSPTAIKPVSAK